MIQAVKRVQIRTIKQLQKFLLREKGSLVFSVDMKYEESITVEPLIKRLLDYQQSYLKTVETRRKKLQSSYDLVRIAFDIYKVYWNHELISLANTWKNS